LLEADRLPAESIAYTVQVVVRSGISFVIVKVVFGGSTLKQPSPSFWTQYHQVPESVDAFHANEMLVSELAVMWRFVGVVGAAPVAGGGGGGGGGGCGGGFFAAAAETATSARARTSAASAVRRTDMRSPPECVVVTTRYGCDDGSGLERPATPQRRHVALVSIASERPAGLRRNSPHVGHELATLPDDPNGRGTEANHCLTSQAIRPATAVRTCS
jgi:hypothetical protein